MSNEKKSYSREFKAKVVLEAVSGESINPSDVAEKYDVSTNQILSWAQEMDISDSNLEKLARAADSSSSGLDEDTDQVELESSDELFISDFEYGVSYDTLNYGRLIFWTVFGTGFVILTVLALQLIFEYSSTTTQQRVSESSEFYQIHELREREQETLSTFGVVDLEEGVYRIPIDSAISRMAQEED